MDFMSDSLVLGQRFRTFNVVDEGPREALAIEVDTSLPAERVIRVLEQIKDSRPLPMQIRVDNGPQLISSKLVEWSEKNGVRLQTIQPGKPTQNAYIEPFNRTFRCEVLDAYLFRSLSEVREIVHHWMLVYNEESPPTTPSAISPQKPSADTKPQTKRPPQRPLFSNCPVDGEAYRLSLVSPPIWSAPACFLGASARKQAVAFGW
jgi:putative transposase